MGQGTVSVMVTGVEVEYVNHCGSLSPQIHGLELHAASAYCPYITTKPKYLKEGREQFYR